MGTAIEIGACPAYLRLDPHAAAVRPLVWYVLNRTAFGRHVYATGDDPDAARLAGIDTDRTLSPSTSLAGLICGHRRLGR